MRVLTEANAKIILEELQERYAQLEQQRKNSKSLRLANKVRLLGMAINQLKIKLDRNGNLV